MPAPRIAVAIASHHRHVPLGIVLRTLPAHWHKVVVVSDGADALAISKGEACLAQVHLYPNSPLGAKWQHAVDKARELDPDLLVTTGSDDVLLVNEPMLLNALDGYDMAGTRSWLAYDGINHYACRYRDHVNLPIGSGRIYRRALLDRLDWRLFDTTRNAGLDQYGYRSALQCEPRMLIADELPGLQVVALKGNWPMKNTLDKYRRKGNIAVTPLPAQNMLGQYQF